MKSITAAILLVLLTGCAPVYYPGYGYGYAPVIYPATAPVQIYSPAPPMYVPSCNWVSQWDAVNYGWRSVQVCR